MTGIIKVADKDDCYNVPHAQGYKGKHEYNEKRNWQYRKDPITIFREDRCIIYKINKSARY